MKSIPENDWKKLQAIKKDVLNISCGRTFKKIKKIMKEQPGNEHKAYLQLWKILKKEDQEISIMFDGFKRSNAIHKLAAWKRNGVIPDDSFSKLSNETQQTVLALVAVLFNDN
jgi:hypothetical protein